jgi:hypothetical protein
MSGPWFFSQICLLLDVEHKCSTTGFQLEGIVLMMGAGKIGAVEKVLCGIL